MSGRLFDLSVYRYAGAAHAGAPGANYRSLARLGRDVVDGGAGRIVDTVDIEGIPAARRVRLVDRVSGRLLRETWSGPASGEYRFEYIALDREYVVYGLDHEARYNAVIADRITAEPMP